VSEYVELLLNGALIGVIATIAMDLWALVVKHVLHLPTANWAHVGRWFAHMPSGKFVHRPIGAAPAVRGELALGWAAHYAIGVAYGIAYLLAARSVSTGFPPIVDALLFSLALLVFPWFVMQPALGAGVFASRTPRPAVARLLSVSMHTAFGLGLYVGARALAAI
jgi:hypothetical protein